MMKKQKNLIGILALCMWGWLLFGANTEISEAYSWTSFEKSPRVIQIDSGSASTIDPDAINLGLVGIENTITVYTANGSIKATEPLYQSKSIAFAVNETARVTKAGIYKGRYVDLVFKNTGPSGGSISLSTTGTISFYRTNQNSSEYYTNYLTMTIVDHETSETFKNNTFYLPTFNSSINYPLGQYVKGYDKQKTNSYYIAADDSFIKTSTYLDIKSMPSFDLISSTGNSQGYFTVYGNMDATGYKFGSVSNVSSATAINFFQSSLKSPLPVDYLPLAIPKTATPSEDQKSMELTMEQTLSKQSKDSYIPSGDSFELSIVEENTKFLNVKKEDFTLSIDGNTIANDGSSYTLGVARSGDKTAITVSLKTDFLKELNKNTQSKVLKINQKSAIIDDETTMKDAINEKKFTMPVSAALSYDLKFDDASALEKSVVTPNQDVSLTLTPPLTADITTGYKVTKGTQLSDIPIDNLVANQKNTVYGWDQVSLAYAVPTTILNTAGNQTVVVNLVSGTFGNTVPVNVVINVQSDYVLTYDSNGGQGIVPKQDTFNTSSSITIANGTTLSKEGSRFVGWSLVKAPTSTDKIYRPGDTYGSSASEKKSVTLYAVWKLNTVLYTSWNSSTLIKELTESIYRNTEEVLIPFYWNVSDKTKYEVQIRLGNEVISTQTIENTVDNQPLTKEELGILLEKVPNNGDNMLSVDFYELDEKGEIIDLSEPNDTLELKLNIELPPISEYTVNFVDEKNNVLHAPYSDSADTGSTVKLDEVAAINEIIDGLKAANYDLTESPANELLLGASSNSVTYKFTGTLKLLSAPSAFDFDIQKVSIKAEKFTNPEIKGDALVVSDTRANKVKWNLKAKLEQPLMSLDDNDVIIPDSIKYGNQEEVITLTDENAVIFSHTNTVSGQYNVTQEHWSKGDGFFLDLAPGAVKALGKYQAKMIITLEDAK
ncbi:InlB B-repeat-containing protein [Enterococcus sp. 5H]|uniref:InlB B-repeat-containing protein n=1 Tax=Enterococcus sp. 5H TaxID=1229490 RepID=UPI002303CC65|nr:InlB B-repeat-containing protein [Enterococcus sp. 5H]MDA9471193.1 hypothetical protein [Enterococcus sp. 5H]